MSQTAFSCIQSSKHIIATDYQLGSSSIPLNFFSREVTSDAKIVILSSKYVFQIELLLFVLSGCHFSGGK